VLRTGAELDAAAARLAAWAAPRPERGRADAGAGLDQAAHEDRNLLLAAQLLVAAAQERTGSVGAHYRTDANVSATAACPAVLAAPARPAPAAGRSTHRHSSAPRPKQRTSS
jgi:L-aspartate oxidase